jgi:hypothetical protein
MVRLHCTLATELHSALYTLVNLALTRLWFPRVRCPSSFRGKVLGA